MIISIQPHPLPGPCQQTFAVLTPDKARPLCRYWPFWISIGRKLKGEKVSIPSHRTGLFVRVSKAGPTEVNGVFDSITVWEHDTNPDTTTITSSLDWFDIADAVSVLFAWFCTTVTLVCPDPCLARGDARSRVVGCYTNDRMLCDEFVTTRRFSSLLFIDVRLLAHHVWWCIAYIL